MIDRETTCTSPVLSVTAFADALASAAELPESPNGPCRILLAELCLSGVQQSPTDIAAPTP